MARKVNPRLTQNQGTHRARYGRSTMARKANPRAKVTAAVRVMSTTAMWPTSKKMSLVATMNPAQAAARAELSRQPRKEAQTTVAMASRAEGSRSTQGW